jgi:spermidine/putrescine transport system substrate-binding protein/spermidine/putrescine transport system permease protein
VTFLRKHPIVVLIGALGIAFMWLPIVVVVLNSLNRDPTLVTWGGFTSTWIRKAIGDPQVRAGLTTSLQVGLLTTVVSVFVALTGVLWWRRASTLGRRVFDVFVFVRLVIPAVVSATALFLIFTRVGVQLGLATTVIGQSVWDSAFATVILQARMRLLDPAVEEAAADLGAKPGSVFFRVTLPSLIPGILAAAVLAFSLSFDDVVTAFFLAGSRVTTLPLLIFGLIRFNVSPEVNAIGTFVTVLLITITFLFVWIVSRSGSGKRSLTRDLGY